MSEQIYFSTKDMAKMTQQRDSWRMTAQDAARDVVRLTAINEELQSFDGLQQAVIERLHDGMELAWGLIANAWDSAYQVNGWVDAAKKWRDEDWSTVASQMSKYKSEIPNRPARPDGDAKVPDERYPVT